MRGCPIIRWTFSLNISCLPYVKDRNVSCRDTFSALLKCPLKTRFIVLILMGVLHSHMCSYLNVPSLIMLIYISNYCGSWILHVRTYIIHVYFPILSCLSVSQSVCLSVRHFRFRIKTRRHIAVFSQNFAGACIMSWGVCCIYSFWYWWNVVWIFLNFLNIEKKNLEFLFFNISCFLRVLCYFQH